MSENLHLQSGYLKASTKKRLKDIDIKYQKGIDGNELTPDVQEEIVADHGHKPKHAEEVRRTSETIEENNASKEHNDLLTNAGKKTSKAYKKAAISLIQGTM